MSKSLSYRTPRPSSYTKGKADYAPGSVPRMPHDAEYMRGWAEAKGGVK